MIEREFISQKLKEHMIKEFISSNLKRVGHSSTKLVRTPLGEKIIITASRPGMIVGKRGQDIKQLTSTLKKKFNLENPQIEINEVENINLDANVVVEKIANSLERYGSNRFKSIGHKMMEEVMRAGALGVEIIIAGKIPSARAKSWRFYSGYLKKCGDIALVGVNSAMKSALLKTGIVGIKVKIMPPDIELPDSIKLKDEIEEKVEEVKEEKKEEKKTTKKTRKK